jgi:hypothetical protein
VLKKDIFYIFFRYQVTEYIISLGTLFWTKQKKKEEKKPQKQTTMLFIKQ